MNLRPPGPQPGANSSPATRRQPTTKCRWHRRPSDRPHQRRLKLDAAFEAALALLLVTGGGASWLTGADLPHPVGRGVVIAIGAALGLLACGLLALARAGVGRGALAGVALANEATALAGLAWLIAARGFTAAGAAIVAAAVAGLFTLSVLQLRAAVTRGGGQALG